ncbi:hypothetical protein O1L60_03145 [Streptomyces diastatochromogenes]|nr:hypothetical protein [Streptomyces diastatochromogenes]
MTGSLALAGLPPFGTGLGKALGEDAAGHELPWLLPAVFVAASAVTGAAALRAGLRVFFGVGPAPRSRPGEEETTGEGEEPEIRSPRRTLPPTMIVVPGVLLALALLLGCLPAAAGRSPARRPSSPTRPATPPRSSPASARPGRRDCAGVRWTVPGVLLGLLSTALAVASATAASTTAARALRPPPGRPRGAGAAPPALRAPRRLPRLALLGLAALCVALVTQT